MRSIAKPQPRRTLTDQQTANLIKLAALPPEQRLAEIMRLVRQAFSSWQLPLLKAWGVTISPQLLRVSPNLKTTLLAHGGSHTHVLTSGSTVVLHQVASIPAGWCLLGSVRRVTCHTH